ncbi:hypothetical protein NLI96_g2275 [Meripilus lineatus]|uniref:Uncharacterized protein n=1 Tax=Meripilus lineatus TaxID=2056292 RepID=A0AAD5V914_9APHY|nr:hypothetical protein NLI96_g2275 [Physisporinus lineatus]
MAIRSPRIHVVIWSTCPSCINGTSKTNKPQGEVEKAPGKQGKRFKAIGEDNLGDLNRDLSAFLGYSMHVIASASPSNAIVFQSRVFGKADTLFEDPVWGSAHSLLTPYWTGKCGEIGSPLEANQVSSWGCDLQVC